MKTKIIILGGFLGAGKTTMLGTVAKHLTQRDHKVGLITNDQASELVDTRFLSASGTTAEVSGSCFCCNFHGFTDAIYQLREQGAQVIVAEPVGSCTDLSATIMQPLKERLGYEFSIAPLSVLADAGRLKEILAGGSSGLHESAAYIVKKQLEEADYIVVNKIDLYPETEIGELVRQTHSTFPRAKVFTVSAQEDVNVTGWLDEVIAAGAAGTHMLTDIDYDVYAEGEAVLGWLNATVSLTAEDKDWADFLAELLNSLSRRFDGSGQAVGHVKALIAESGNFVVGNFTGKNHTLKLRGESNRSPKVTLTLNARVEMPPEELEAVVREELAKLTGKDVKAEITVLKCLSPGRPNPTYRYDHVV